jgi:bacterioferritin (cytochrome b1)
MKGHPKILAVLNELLADELTAITFAHQVEGQATVDLLMQILKMDEGHVDWAEIQRKQMGLENDLANQTGGA